jgi:hypothetical protein
MTNYSARRIDSVGRTVNGTRGDACREVINIRADVGEIRGWPTPSVVPPEFSLNLDVALARLATRDLRGRRPGRRAQDDHGGSYANDREGRHKLGQREAAASYFVCSLDCHFATAFTMSNMGK